MHARARALVGPIEPVVAGALPILWPTGALVLRHVGAPLSRLPRALGQARELLLRLADAGHEPIAPRREVGRVDRQVVRLDRGGRADDGLLAKAQLVKAGVGQVAPAQRLRGGHAPGVRHAAREPEAAARRILVVAQGQVAVADAVPFAVALAHVAGAAFPSALHGRRIPREAAAGGGGRIGGQLALLILVRAFAVPRPRRPPLVGNKVHLRRRRRVLLQSQLRDRRPALPLVPPLVQRASCPGGADANPRAQSIRGRAHVERGGRGGR